MDLPTFQSKFRSENWNDWRIIVRRGEKEHKQEDRISLTYHIYYFLIFSISKRISKRVYGLATSHERIYLNYYFKCKCDREHRERKVDDKWR